MAEQKEGLIAAAARKMCDKIRSWRRRHTTRAWRGEYERRDSLALKKAKKIPRRRKLVARRASRSDREQAPQMLGRLTRDISP
jgi:hypothetical protein